MVVEGPSSSMVFSRRRLARDTARPRTADKSSDQTLPLIGEYDVDDDLLEAVRNDGHPRLRVMRWTGKPAVVLGRGSDPVVELDVPSCLTDEVTVLRRRGGGCSVVIDPGNLVISVILPQQGLGGVKKAFEGITAWLAEALERLGVEGVHRRGISDLVMGEQKIGGSCIYRSKALLYYSTTLMVDPDLVAMERWLAHPPREPDYRKGRRHAAFVRGIGGEWTTRTLSHSLRYELDLSELVYKLSA